MGEEGRMRTAYPAEPVSCSLGLMDKPLEFAARPANDIEVDPFEGGTQLRPVEVTVVADPAADDGIIDRGQLFKGFVAPKMKPPTPDFPADARQRLWASGGLEVVREDAAIRLHPHRFPGTELKAQKIKRDHRKVPAPVH